MRLSRRHVLLAAAAATAAGPCGSVTVRADDAAPRPEAGPILLNARAVQQRLPGASAPTEILSFDGSAGGPVLRVVQGAALDLRVTNSLELLLSLQWHGVRAPNAVEGDWPLAGERLAPGATQAIRFTPPDSGLSWFRCAALRDGPDLTGRGLRGVLIVDEPKPPLADRDALLTLDDWPVAAGAPPALTVNGAEAPALASIVPGGRLRLRVLNASTTRAMILGIEGARPLIIAIDGQPSDLFEPVRDSVPVGPGARFEFMIDMPREAGAALRLLLRAEGADRSLFECRTEGAARVALPPIAALPRNSQLSPQIPLEKSVRADLRIEAAVGAKAFWRLNGAASLDLPRAPLVKARPGEPVTLGFDNRSGAIVPLRVHGHVMRLLHAKDDGWEPYWRDNVILLPNSVTHVAFIADNPGRWLIESTLFEQAAFGLRSWFEVG